MEPTAHAFLREEPVGGAAFEDEEAFWPSAFTRAGEQLGRARMLLMVLSAVCFLSFLGPRLAAPCCPRSGRLLRQGNRCGIDRFPRTDTGQLDGLDTASG